MASINLSQRAKSSAGRVSDESGGVTVPLAVLGVDCEAGEMLVDGGDAVWMGGPKLAWVVPIVTAIFVETERPFMASMYLMLIVPEPRKLVVGVNFRPFSHSLRLVNVPLIVIDAELFIPETKVIPVVDPSPRLP
jgi:hypothetical protein